MYNFILFYILYSIAYNIEEDEILTQQRSFFYVIPLKLSFLCFLMDSLKLHLCKITSFDVYSKVSLFFLCLFFYLIFFSEEYRERRRSSFEFSRILTLMQQITK